MRRVCTFVAASLLALGFLAGATGGRALAAAGFDSTYQFESAFLSQRIAVMAARPGRMIEEIAIEAPYPRTEKYLISPENNATCRRVSAALAIRGTLTSVGMLTASRSSSRL